MKLAASIPTASRMMDSRVCHNFIKRLSIAPLQKGREFLVEAKQACEVGEGRLMAKLAQDAQQVAEESGDQVGQIVALLAVKIPLVYGGLAALILWKLPPALAIVAGFSLVLVIIVLRAAGRALLDSGLLGGAERD